MENYNQVPNIITGKDLDYLSDMFKWNYGAFKQVSNALNNASDTNISEVLNKSCELFLNNMNSVLNILGGHNE